MHRQDVDLKLDDAKLLTICYQNVIHVDSLLNFGGCHQYKDFLHKILLTIVISPFFFPATRFVIEDLQKVFQLLAIIR